MSQTVYVATVDTRYEIMAVATTEADAIRIACEKALEWLKAQDAVSDETDTVEKIADYFGVFATKLAMNSAAIVGV
jgi:hypothetical protein